MYTRFSARITNPLIMAAEYGYCDVLHAFLDKIRPLGEQFDAEISLAYLDYRKEGRAKLISILQRLWDLGLLQNHSSDVGNELDETMVHELTTNDHSVRDDEDISRVATEDIHANLGANFHILILARERNSWIASSSILMSASNQDSSKISKALSLMRRTTGQVGWLS